VHFDHVVSFVSRVLRFWK